MKKILLSVGSLAVIGALSYPGFGFLVEKGIRHQIEMMPKQYGMTVELKDFHRHWFSSDAKLFWHWDIPAHLKQNAQGQTITVSPQHFEKEINIQIAHGPIVFNKWQPFFGIGYAATTFNWPFKESKVEFAKDSTFPQINVRMGLDFLMHTHWNTEVPAFSLISSDNTANINWGGMVLKNNIATNLDKISGNMYLKSLAIKNPQMSADIANFSSSYDFSLNKVGLYIGNATIALDKFSLGNTLQFNDLKVNNDSAIADNLFSTEINLSLQSANINGTVLGPLSTKLQLSKINAAALYKVKKSFDQQQNASPNFRNKNLMTLVATIPELLKYGLQLNLQHFHLNLKNGVIDGKMQFTLPADEKSAAMLNIARMQTLSGTADFALGSTLVKDWLIDLVQKQLASQQQGNVTTVDLASIATARTSEKLASLVNDKVLIQKDEQYILHIKLQNGNITINDLAFNPAWLMI